MMSVWLLTDNMYLEIPGILLSGIILFYSLFYTRNRNQKYKDQFPIEI